MTHTPSFPSSIPDNIRKFILTMLEKNLRKRAKIDDVLLNSWLLEKNEKLLNIRMSKQNEGDNKFAAFTISDIRKLDSNKEKNDN